jgi:hypothetical protein
MYSPVQLLYANKIINKKLKKMILTTMQILVIEGNYKGFGGGLWF